MFAGLQPARIEAALRAARIVAMQPGEVIIRQGDPADNFYVIAEGEVEVTQTAAATAAFGGGRDQAACAAPARPGPVLR